MNEFYHKFQPKEWNKVKYFGGIRKAWFCLYEKQAYLQVRKQKT